MLCLDPIVRLVLMGNPYFNDVLACVAFFIQCWELAFAALRCLTIWFETCGCWVPTLVLPHHCSVPIVGPCRRAGAVWLPLHLCPRWAESAVNKHSEWAEKG